jgi:hypothetical protein
VRDVPTQPGTPDLAPSRETTLEVIGEQVDELLARSRDQQGELDELRARLNDLEQAAGLRSPCQSKS